MGEVQFFDLFQYNKFASTWRMLLCFTAFREDGILEGIAGSGQLSVPGKRRKHGTALEL